MRTRLSVVMVVLAAVSVLGQGTPQRDAARVTFEAAKKMESVDGDLPAAIALYRQVSAGADRELAAQAELRLSAINRRLGDAPGTTRRDVPVTSLVTLDDTMWDAIKTYLTPDGRYLSRYSNSGEVFITDLTNGRSERLKSGEAESAMVSPDGRRIALMVSHGDVDPRTRTYEIQVRERGANARSTTIATLAASGSLYAWSPDGRSILANVVNRDETRPGRGRGNFPALSTHIAVLSVDERRVTLMAPSQTLRASFSPDNRYIAYSANTDSPAAPQSPESREASSIYVQPVDGSAPKEVVGGASRNQRPIWTPDGRHLLFLSDRSGTFKLYSVAVENGTAKGQPSPVKGSQIAGAVVPLAVTRNGTFYYVTPSKGTDTDVYQSSFGPDGRFRGSPTRVSNNFENQLAGPAYSPTGDRIAFLRRVVDGEFRLVIRELDSGRERVYQEPLRMRDLPRSPVWMPDGRSILLLGGPSPDNVVRRLELGSGAVTSIRRSFGPIMNPSFSVSRDGRTFYFVSGASKDIHAIDRDGGNERVVWTAPDGKSVLGVIDGIAVVGTGGGVDGIALSPDGRTFAITRGTTGDGPHSLARVGVDGTGYVELAKEVWPAGAVWTPDGQAILYRNDGRLMRIPATGGTPQFTGLTMYGIHEFSVRPPAGAQIAFSEQVRPELWKMERLTSVLAP